MDFPADREIPDSQSDPGSLDIDLGSEFHDGQPTLEVLCNEQGLTNLNTEVEDNHNSNFGNNFQDNHEESTDSYTTVATQIIADSPPHTLQRYPRLILHEDGINVNGRLAIEAFRYANRTDMAAEEGPTQKATQDYIDPRRHGLSSMSMKDEADIICTLQPTNPAAFEVVRVVAEVSPQHVLHNQGLSCQEEDSLTLDTLDDQQPRRIQQNSADIVNEIALRISSKVNDVCMGFIFGRDPGKSDIVIDVPDERRRISGMHFRIFVNMEGIIMLEDISTNGTMVEGKILRYNPAHGAGRPRHMISHGSTIQLLLGANGSILFTVKVLDRDQGVAEYTKRLGRYLAHISEEKKSRLARLNPKARALSSNVPVTQGGCDKTQETQALTRFQGVSNTMLTAGSVVYHQGSHWNGGEKYNVVSHIGKGAFADVFKFATKREGNVFAVKQLEKIKFIKNGVLDQKFLNELRIMEMIDHPHIIKFVEYNDKPEYLFIVMEYIQHGDLLRYLKRCNTLSEPQGHLDPFIVKLSDFGLSKVITSDETFLMTFCGTLLYCAPEVYPEYELLMKGAGKRTRYRETNSRSPYSSAVDLWSLAAVVFHLLTDEPPYKGNGEHRGSAMVRTIIESPLDLTPLYVSRISARGISFLQQLLRLDPVERLTASKCLSDPWIRDVVDVINIDINEDDAPQALEAIQEEIEEIEEQEEGLDASQLSLNDRFELTEHFDFESEDEISDVDEIDHAHLSKRPKVHQDIIAANHMQPLVGAFSYPTLPIAGQTKPTSVNHSATNRLFGEIGASDLRSSGVLSHGAHAALQITSDANRETERSFDRGEASDFYSNRAASHNIHHVTATAHPYLRQPIGSAPSLFGTEAQVRRLQVESPESASSVPATPQTPTTPMSRRGSRASSSALTGSKRSRQAMQPDTDDTPKRPRLASPEMSMNLGEYADADTHSLGLASRGSARNLVLEPEDRLVGVQANIFHEDSAIAAGNHGAVETTVTSAIGARPLSSENESRPGARSSTDPGFRGYHNVHSRHGTGQTNVAALTRNGFNSNLHTAANQRLEDIPLASAGTSNGPFVASTDDRAVSEFTGFPQTLGKLVTLPGSIIEISLTLRDRHTTYGRDPESTYVYPDCMDTRIPKSAMDILFWRVGIDDDVNSGAGWFKPADPDLSAIIVSRASKGIKVNNIRLPFANSQGNFKLYGYLRHGDIITIYDSGAEFLKFRCEFYFGLSSQARDPGEIFTVLREDVSHL
ncbi:hypothetical protein MMC13_005699 [Lambiella insularis]|nr:hypothetical protein [Lambiella insularis]